MKSIGARTALYLLLTGIALGVAVYIWHTWSDNAYLGPVLLALLLLAAGAVLATVAAARGWGLVPALGSLAAAGVIAVALVGPIGATRPLAEAIVAGGNGSQSPCIAEFRRQHAEEIAKHEEEMRQRDAALGIRPLSPEEARASEVSGVMGGLAQPLVPFLAGLAPLALAVRRTGARALVRGLVPAAAVIAVVYVRGPGAWCGQLFGLDVVVLIVAGIVVAAGSPRPGRIV